MEGVEPTPPGSPVTVPVRPRPITSPAEDGTVDVGDARLVSEVFATDPNPEPVTEPATVLPTVVRYVLSLSTSASVAMELVMSFGRKEGEAGKFATASAVSPHPGEPSGDALGELVSEGGLGEAERTDAEREKYELLSPV